MRLPYTVSCIVSMMRVEPSKERRAKRRTLRMSLASSKPPTRHDRQRDERHHRILRDHHGDEADQGEDVAAETGDQELQRIADAIGREREPAHELARMPVLKEAQILADDIVEYTGLN